MAGIAEVAADPCFLGYSTLATAADKAGIRPWLNSEFGKAARVSVYPCHCTGLAASAARDASGGPVLVLEVVMPGDRHELEDAYQVG